jgi:Flp pilus assembly protein TadD
VLPYLHEEGSSGYRAAWLAHVIYASKQDYSSASEAIRSHPQLANDIAGKEALARYALLQGDIELADHLYASLSVQSPEAMSYLARRAYVEGDWQQAQELTEKLLSMFPDSPVLRDNLNRIMEEQKGLAHHDTE